MRFYRFLAILAVALVAGGATTESKLRLACNDFPPHKIEAPGADGLRGFDIDIIDGALQRIGWSADFTFMPWKRALELVERGEYDGLCSCSYTKEREDTLLFSDELGAVSVGLFARSSQALDGLARVADLKGRKVATVGGYNLEGELTKVGAIVEAASSDKSALDMLVGGNVDVLYAYELTAKHFLASDPRAAEITYKELRRNPYYFCLSRVMPDAETVMRDLNNSLDAMAEDGSIATILERYHVTFR